MRAFGWLLLVTMLVTTTGCGGCGGGTSLAEMKRRAIRRVAEDEETPPPPKPQQEAVQPAPAVAAPTPAAPVTPPAPAPAIAKVPLLNEDEPAPASPAKPAVKAPLLNEDEPAPAPARPAVRAPLLNEDEPAPAPAQQVVRAPLMNEDEPAPAPAGRTPAKLPRGEQPVVALRHELPDAEAQRAGKKILAELYRADYENARTPPQKLALAKQLLAKAPEMQDDVVGHYLLLNLIQDLALKSGDVTTTMQALDMLAAHFVVDSAALKFKALESLAKSIRSEADAKLYLQQCAKVVADALAQDDFELAAQTQDAALIVAKRANKPAEINQLAAAKKMLDEAKAAYVNVPAARSALQQDPTQADANLALGRYLCLYRRDWEQGLHHLAQASDIKLKVLAQIDLSAPTQGQQQADLGDQWYDLATDARPCAQQALAARAGYWYSLALGALPRGLAKARVQKRLQEIADLTGDTTLQAFASSKKPLVQD